MKLMNIGKKIGRAIVDDWIDILRGIKEDAGLFWFLVYMIGGTCIIMGYLLFLYWTIVNGIWYIGLLVLIPVPPMLKRLLNYTEERWF